MLAAARRGGDWHKALGTAMRESEQQFKALVESLPHLVWTTDDEGSGSFTCTDWQNYTGLSLEASRGDGWTAALHPEDLPKQTAVWRESVPTGQRYELEVRLRRGRDGAYRWHILCGAPVRRGSGPPRSWINTATDVHDRKLLEQALYESQDALRESKNLLEQRVAERTAESEQRADQLARLASDLTLTEQRERRRLAKVLHDHVQQLMVAAKLRLGFLSSRLNERQQASIAEVSDLIDASIQASRGLTADLSSPILHEGGLAAGLEWLARSVEEKYGLKVHLDLNHDVDPDRDDVRVLVFEAVRELLFNIARPCNGGFRRIDRGRPVAMRDGRRPRGGI